MSFWSRIERRLSELADELVPDQFQAQIAEARQLIDAGQAAQAVELLEAIISKRPDHRGALCLLGVARLATGNPDKALSWFDKALASDDELPEALIGQGQARLALGSANDAVSSYRAAVSAARGDRSVLAEAYRGLGEAYGHLGETDKAVRELRKAVAEAPRDAGSLAALGGALAVMDGGREEAVEHLERATAADDCPASAWVSLGRIFVDDGDRARAELCFASALERARDKETQAAALVGQGDVHRLVGDDPSARGAYEAARDLVPKAAEPHVRLGQILSDAGDHGAALSYFRSAVERGGGLAATRLALDAALQCDDLDDAVQLANQILDSDSGDPRALTARGRALASDGKSEAARATFEEALRRADDAEAHLALGELALANADPQAAADRARIALRANLDNQRARSLLSGARQQQLSTEVSGADWYQLATALHALCVTEPKLSDLAPEAARAASDFDHPLLVTIMGEFSSGKSSLVNAFIGRDVAPTGITPTTATINVLKYGRERAGRIVYRSGGIEDVAWEELNAVLNELGQDKVRRVDHVEILMPLEILERISIVDTPGLNSILPEHEATAQDFMRRADAVVWVFAAGQAGKASERTALQTIRDQGVRVLAVINKIDQLSSSDADEVVAHIEKDIGELVEAVVPLSARQALADREDERWRALSRALEERFFAQARDIKRSACDRRLGQLLDQAAGRVQQWSADHAHAEATLRGAATSADELRVQFLEQVVAAERRAAVEGAAHLYRGAAREILELVQPRTLPFGSHKASRADRDYLMGLLDTGFDQLLASIRTRVTAALESMTAPILSVARSAAADAEIGRGVASGIRLVQAEVFTGCRSYLRGYLRGGYVDDFFRSALPKIDLDEDAIYHALYRDSPNLDAQIALPLARAGDRLLEELGDRLEELADAARVEVIDLEVGLAPAIASIDERRKTLADNR